MNTLTARCKYTFECCNLSLFFNKNDVYHYFNNYLFYKIDLACLSYSYLHLFILVLTIHQHSLRRKKAITTNTTTATVEQMQTTDPSIENPCALCFSEEKRLTCIPSGHLAHLCSIQTFFSIMLDKPSRAEYVE
jgi:hypothetical protein